MRSPTRVTRVDSPAQRYRPQLGIRLLEVDALVRVGEARTSFGVDGKGLSVAVLDTGLRSSHVDFRDRVVAEANFTSDNGGNGSDATDGQGHGTNVTGIVAADGDHVGVAPGAGIVPLKVLDDDGGGSFGAVAEGLYWVLEYGESLNVSVVCMSLGDGENYQSDQFDGDPIGESISMLKERGVAVCVASGNDFFKHGSVQGMSYPGIFRDTISVGAVYDQSEGGFSYKSGAEAYSTAADQITPFSQRLHEDESAACHTDVFAPGAPTTSAGILSDHGESTQHGTSQATPVVTGVVLLCQQFVLKATGNLPHVDDIVSWLRLSGVAIVDGDDENDNVEPTGLTYRRVDAVGALRAATRWLERSSLD